MGKYVYTFNKAFIRYGGSTLSPSHDFITTLLENMKRQKICILSLSTIHRDGRVLRQIAYASRKYDVTVVGWGHLDKSRPNVQMKSVQKWNFSSLQRIIQVALMAAGRLNSQFWERWYWRKPDHRQALEFLCSQHFDLIHVNEVIALPIAIAVSRKVGAKVLFDAHEYSPENRANNWQWRILSQPFYTYLIRTYAHQAQAMTTVALGIVDKYAAEFSLSPQLIMNTPLFTEQPFRPVNPSQICMIHHGSAIRERSLEQMIEVVALLDLRYTLDFMLRDKGDGYLQLLRKYAERIAPGRVRFRETVLPAEIPDTINAYDIGLFLIPPVNYNYEWTLPNKFFEFMMAGLAIAIGPSPEMARICRKYNVGVISKDFSPQSLAECLNQLTAEQINQMKKNSLEAAKVFNADVEMRKLLDIYESLLRAE